MTGPKKSRRVCLDDLTQEQVDQLLHDVAQSGGTLTIDITPAVDRMLEAERKTKKPPR